MHLFYRTITLILLISIISGCQNKSENASENSSSASGQTEQEQQNETVEHFEGHGKVVSVPPSKRNFIVQHGDIPGFMNAMTMAFSVRDTALLQNVQPQDSIRFEIESRGSSAVVTTVEVIE